MPGGDWLPDCCLWNRGGWGQTKRGFEGDGEAGGEDQEGDQDQAGGCTSQGCRAPSTCGDREGGPWKTQDGPKTSKCGKRWSRQRSRGGGRGEDALPSSKSLKRRETIGGKTDVRGIFSRLGSHRGKSWC